MSPSQQLNLHNSANQQKTSGRRILTQGRVAGRAVIDDGMIPFAAYSAADS